MSRRDVCNVLRVRYIGTQPTVAAGPCVKMYVRMWIVRIALNRPYTFVVLALLILGIGPLTIARTPTDIFPNIDIPVVSVIWNYGGLSAQDREVLVMTVAARNGCHLCVAMHTATLYGLSASPELVAALRAQSALPSPRLEALRVFVNAVMDTTGDVPPSELAAFIDAGYTARNALEAVLGIGTYTLSTFANRLTGAPLDEAFADHAWHAA